MRYPSKIYRNFIFTLEFMRFLLIDRIQQDKDNIVLFTGRRGQGKSTLSIKQIISFNDLKKIQEIYNKGINLSNNKREFQEKCKTIELQEFNFDRDIVFTTDELQNLCQNSRKGFILADEAVVSVSRRGSMTKINKMLHQILTINRKNNNTIFLCLPSIEDLDVSILQYLTMWIHVEERGKASVFMPSRASVFGRKTWDVDSMKKILDKFIDKNPRVGAPPNWIYENFRGYIGFGKLPKKVEEKYLRLAEEKKNLEAQKTEEKKVKKDRLGKDKRLILKKIVDDLVNGGISDSADYYKYCADLEFKKERLNKEVNNALLKIGEGRNFSRIIKENHEAKQSKIDEASDYFEDC